MPVELGIEEQLRAGAAIVGLTLRLVTPVRRQTLSLQLPGSSQRLGATDDCATDFTADQRITELIDQSLGLIATGPRINGRGIRQREPAQNG